MAMDAGNEACTTGLASELHTAIAGKAYSKAFVTSDDWKKFIHAVATAVVAHIQNTAKTSADNEDIL
jgi:nicotinamide mononucleotide (NMN) deamidase PncC